MNIIFFGTSEFAIPALETLKKAGMPPLLVVSTPDKPRGRKLVLSASPIKEWAEKNGIAVITPEKLKDEKILSELKNRHPDVFIVASYGNILSKEILDIPPKGTINIHPSLLPQFRGPSPIQTAILENVETGVTLMLTDEEVDHGPILAQQELEITNNKLQITNNLTYKELEKELAGLGASMLIETLPRWLNGEIIPQEQDHSQATFTKKISKEDGRINWQEPAEIIERKTRAFNPWPGTFTFYEKDPSTSLDNAPAPWARLAPKGRRDESLGTSPSTALRTGKKKRLLILKARIEKTDGQTQTPGTITQTKNGEFAVTTSDGLLIIEKLKPEGKNEIIGRDFLQGYPNIQNQKLI